MSSAEGPFGPGWRRGSDAYSRRYLELREGLMESQERRWPQGDRNLRYARWINPRQSESQKQSIPWCELGRSLARTLQSQQLMLEH